jgi:hypothetical protein
MEDRTTEQLAQDFTAMGHSVDLINAIIAGDSMADESAEDRQDCVDRNTTAPRVDGCQRRLG